MTIVVYADFTDPTAWLLSQRRDVLSATTGERVQWRAVHTTVDHR
jgi:2-hydroxychromene-2-carboxylate isomerase